jgi:hypothetical protein
MKIMDGSGTCARNRENKEATFFSPRTREPCGYIVAEGAGGVQFCDAPAVRGSSYCAHHRARCGVAPDTQAGRALVAELAREAERPPLAPIPLDALEFDATEPEEVIATLDLPRADAAEDAP